MLAKMARLARKLASDPVLRRWLLSNFLAGRRPGRMPARTHPPYLPARGTAQIPSPTGCRQCEAASPERPILLALAGRQVLLAPADAAEIFVTGFDDPEVTSALHRFAWLPLAEDNAETAAWVCLLWRHWAGRCGDPTTGGLGWEAYSAAERAVTILDWSRRHGLPGPAEETLSLLARHGRAILDGLEYFGETGTCNHLANNGRGLFRLGLDLGLAELTEAGATIVEREAERIFLPSGVLREGSSHYHLLYVRNWADCWLAARRHGHPATDGLQARLWQLFTVLPALVLPGGLPLVGDISPDSPPPYLAGLLPGAPMEQGWTGSLEAEERAALAALRDNARPDQTALAADGWLRADFGDWSGLWHAEPAGWALPTGHGHEDIGSAEIHLCDQPLFIDPGRGAYGEDGEAALYRSAAVHGLLQVDGIDPYPANKPYYTDAFRAGIAKPAPILTAEADGVSLSHGGYARLPGIGLTRRRWRFEGKRLTMEDMVEGHGRHGVVRRLVTPWPVRMENGAVVVQAPVPVRVWAEDCNASIVPIKRWLAYNHPQPANAIAFAETETLPWRGRVVVERIDCP